MKESVAAVVVTYNRKVLLLRCLEAIRKQTYLPDIIYIIDNLSTDGTPEFLFENRYITDLPKPSLKTNQLIQATIFSLNQTNKKIEINYIRKYENDGGAGGFYEGMKLAYEQGYDWLWLMDDDGIPDKNCLINLYRYSSKSVLYLAPNLIDLKNNSHFDDKFQNVENEIVAYKGGPFNGILINKLIIKVIGLPLKKFFIWGDETEYTNRIIEAGFIVATVREAKLIHPRTSIDYKTNKRLYYLIRNLFISARLFKGIYRSKQVYFMGVISVFMHTCLKLLFYFRFKELLKILEGFIIGITIDLNKIKNEE